MATEMNSVSPLLYMLILLIIGIIFWLVYVFKQKNFTKKDYLKLLIYALIGTVILEIIYFIIGKIFRLFEVMCGIGDKCPSSFEIFVEQSIYLIPTIFIIIAVIYSTFRFFRD